MPKLLLTISSVALVALLTMAQISGPTTRTPRLTVGPGDTTVTDLIVLGECTGCGGGGGGLTQTSDTFELTWEASCTADVAQTWRYVLTGDLVTLTMVDALSCTADVAGFASDADMPMAIRPAQSINFGTGLGATDNNTPLDTIAVCLRVNTSGSVNIIRGASGDLTCAGSGTGGWTSGARGLTNGGSGGWNTFSYSIN
jgi:hypothetical protein